MNPQLTCSQRQWLHSSVGRASHWYCEVTGSNSVEVLNFFSGFFTQLHELRSVQQSFFSFSLNKLVHSLFILNMTALHQSHKHPPLSQLCFKQAKL